MDRFVHEQNLRYLREVLARTIDQGDRRGKCRRIVVLRAQLTKESAVALWD